jgi:hypothetical protein
MLSIQKCPTNETGLGYVPPSTSQTIFAKPIIPKSLPSCVDKGKLLWKEKFQLSLNQWQSFLSEESLPHAITMVRSGTSGLSSNIGKLRGRQIGKLLKLPCVTNVELAVMFDLVVHLKRNHLGIMDLLLEILFQGISSSKEDLGPQEALFGEREIFYEGTPFVSSFMRYLVRYLELQLNKGGQDKDEDTHSLRGSEPTHA